MGATAIADPRFVGAILKSATNPHGQYSRYRAGCRCKVCTDANRLYGKTRKAARLAGDVRGRTSATKTRQHLHLLSAKGVGVGLISAISGVDRTLLLKIKGGKRNRVRQDTERHVLAVSADAVSSKTLVSAEPTRLRIAALLDRGFSRAQLMVWLERKPTTRLPIFRDWITARTEMRVVKLYSLVEAGKLRRDPKLDGIVRF